MRLHRRLRRLDRIWVPDAVYFITCCVQDRRPILANSKAALILCDEWASASTRHGWRIGRYVIMPDHVHFFCAEQPGGAKRKLSAFMNQWKTWTAHRLMEGGLFLNFPIWQSGFFDHVLRSNESYAEKWSYVRENPIRSGLVEDCAAWPWQGFVDFDEPLTGH